ncbi:ShlB/FhaC/HecB family hemolysin secretion/activation protein [Alteromonas ponticola]|uniref:ShlB/FhaC/HecB family hemolysin secretion/activation protein n=1 Tax=Alteromonas ponticola TaxID=2720613 RepID=A0ABX1QZP1_9ALTE|nr:ShlB/FhaC/HecB family hemolysin secretion/activation protein [Alteromonas ponticola]
MSAKTSAQQPVFSEHEKIIKQGLDRLENQIEPLKNRPVIHLSRPESVSTSEGTSASDQCFNITSIEVSGEKSIAADEIQRVTSPFYHRCLGLEQINALLGSITNLYLDKGYVTSRAYIGPQDLSDGHLEIDIVEGFVETLSSTDQSITAQQLAWAFPVTIGNTLNIRDIEQGLENLNTLTGNNTTVALNPALQQGGSEVAINNQPAKHWQGSVGLNNYGVESTGEYQLDANLVMGNLVGINDTTLFSASTNIGGHDLPHAMSRSYALSWSVPVHYWSLGAQSNFYEYEQIVVGENSNFAIHGSSFNSSLQLGYTVYRDQTDKIDLALSLTRKTSKNFIEDVFLDTSSRVLYVWDFHTAYRRSLSQGSLSAGLHIYKSVSWFDAKKKLVAAEDDFQFIKYQANLAYNTQWRMAETPILYAISANYLYSPDIILASEGLTVGGRYTVRGLSQSSLFGYKGGYIRNEFTLPVASELSFINQIHYFFGVDAGVSNLPEYPQENSEWVAGSVVGIKWHGNQVEATLSYARALRVPDFFTQKQQEVDLSLRVSF